jgi:hypothetical protein
MRIAIMQPYFFPYIGYFQLLNYSDKFVLLDDVNYINRGWINRNRILINGNAHWFTLPLKEASQNKHINEIEIFASYKEKKKMIKTIELAYKKANYFKVAFPLIEEIILHEEKNLSKFLYNSILKLSNYFNIKTQIIPSSSIYGNNHLKGQERIIDICIKENTKEYLNLPGGIELYNREEFRKKNIILLFLKPKEIKYAQFNNEFVPWLSIIDLLMFNSKEKIVDYLNQFELI